MLRSFIVLGAIALAACGRPEPARTDDTAELARSGLRYLGPGADDAFARALEPRGFSFPIDHGPHRAFRSEWWYFTGNLDGGDGRRFGFQLTFFRFGLTPQADDRAERSAWRARDAWMAHFTITDARGQRFYAHERLAREAVGLAGATEEPLRVWVKDWSLEGSVRESGTTWRLAAGQDSLGLELELTSAAPPVSNGDRGLDRKGPEPGNASFYYSIPRLAARGTITIDGESIAVDGSAWLDREWSTSALSPGIVGWDWFALQLDDGSTLMFYRLRTAAGDASPFSGGTLLARDGTQTRLSATDATIAVRRQWSSRRSGRKYPVEWRLEVPGGSIDLSIEAVVDDQELDVSVRYWEGAVDVEGTVLDRAITGRGYVELTGY